MTDIVLIPDPNRTLTVLRNEAEAARDGTLVIDCPDIEMAELLDDAADEIERLRAVVERQRNALKSILNEVLYGGTDLNDEPDIDRIHDFATTGLREDRLVTANTAANTADAATNETDATP